MPEENDPERPFQENPMIEVFKESAARYVENIANEHVRGEVDPREKLKQLFCAAYIFREFLPKPPDTEQEELAMWYLDEIIDRTQPFAQFILENEVGPI